MFTKSPDELCLPFMSIKDQVYEDDEKLNVRLRVDDGQHSIVKSADVIIQDMNTSM